MLLIKLFLLLTSINQPQIKKAVTILNTFSSGLLELAVSFKIINILIALPSTNKFTHSYHKVFPDSLYPFVCRSICY